MEGLPFVGDGVCAAWLPQEGWHPGCCVIAYEAWCASSTIPPMAALPSPASCGELMGGGGHPGTRCPAALHFTAGLTCVRVRLHTGLWTHMWFVFVVRSGSRAGTRVLY